MKPLIRPYLGLVWAPPPPLPPPQPPAEDRSLSFDHLLEQFWTHAWRSRVSFADSLCEDEAGLGNPKWISGVFVWQMRVACFLPGISALECVSEERKRPSDPGQIRKSGQRKSFQAAKPARFHKTPPLLSNPLRIASTVRGARPSSCSTSLGARLLGWGWDGMEMAGGDGGVAERTSRSTWKASLERLGSICLVGSYTLSPTNIAPVEGNLEDGSPLGGTLFQLPC